MDAPLPTRPHHAMRNVWLLRGVGLVAVLFPFLAWPLVLPLASLLRLAGVGFVLSFFAAGGIVLVAALVAVVAWSRLAYHRIRFEIRADEVMIERGVLVRTVTHIPLAKVRRIVLRSGPLLRRRGLASIRILVEDRWAATPYAVDGQLPGVPNAPGVSQVLVERINRAKGAPSASAPFFSPAAR